MTQAIFIETAKAEDLAVKDKKRRLNVSGVLRIWIYVNIVDRKNRNFYAIFLANASH